MSVNQVSVCQLENPSQNVQTEIKRPYLDTMNLTHLSKLLQPSYSTYDHAYHMHHEL